MANYYNSPYYGNPPRYDQVSPAPEPFRRQNAATPVSSISPSPYAASEADLQHPQHSHSHHSLGSDAGYGYGSGYPMAAARGNEHEQQYSDNIPLKSHAATPMPADWMHQPTHYPPPASPEGMPAGEPLGAPRGRRDKKRFWKNFPWVTYLLTTVQIIVFIVQLVKNGMSRARPVSGVHISAWRKYTNLGSLVKHNSQDRQLKQNQRLTR